MTTYRILFGIVGAFLVWVAYGFMSAESADQALARCNALANNPSTTLVVWAQSGCYDITKK